MEFNRNHYFIVGIVIFLLGLQLRLVDSYVCNEKTTRILAEKFGSKTQSAASGVSSLWAAEGPTPRKVIRPPDWLGWLLMSVGSVLILHSLAMPRPAG